CVQLGHGRFAGYGLLEDIVCPGGTIHEQCRSIDCEGHFCKLSLCDLELRKTLSESPAILRPAHSFIERSTRKPQRGRADRRAKKIECRKSDLKSLSLLADDRCSWYTAIFEFESSDGMRCDYIEATNFQSFDLARNEQR